MATTQREQLATLCMDLATAEALEAEAVICRKEVEAHKRALVYALHVIDGKEDLAMEMLRLRAEETKWFCLCCIACAVLAATFLAWLF